MAYIGVDGLARKVKAVYIGVDGVARKVKTGYVGVDGVARKFLADEQMATIAITGSYSSYDYAYVSIDGTRYTNGDVITVPVGTVITCYTGDEDEDGTPAVYLNGTQINDDGAYYYSVVGNATIYLSRKSYENKDGVKCYYGVIRITEK